MASPGCRTDVDRDPAIAFAVPLTFLPLATPLQPLTCAPAPAPLPNSPLPQTGQSVISHAVTGSQFKAGAQMIVRFLSWLVVGVVLLMRTTCRIHFHNDPRGRLRDQDVGYLFSFLHAHQLSVMSGSEAGTAAMVSRSNDGSLIVPALEHVGCVVYRGSKKSNSRARGGQQAIDSLVEHVAGGRPAAIAVDGPRGPRGRVHKGVAMVSQRTGAAVLNIVAVPRRRWIAWKAWDRMQIPVPFHRIDGYFADPIYPRDGEKLEAYRQRIEASLHELEARLDPAEHRYSVGPRSARGAGHETAKADEPAEFEPTPIASSNQVA